MLSIAEIENSVMQTGAGALLFVKNYISGLIWRNDSTTYLSDSHSKDEYCNLSSSGTTILLKFNSLHSVENYIKYVYHNTYLLTLYFQVEYIKVHCSPSAKNVTKCALKKAWLLARWKKDLNARKRISCGSREKNKQLKRDIIIKKNP